MNIHRLQFSIDIKADKKKIWDTLWINYKDWANIFSEGSYAVTNDWKEGTIVHFLAVDKSGVYSTIEKHTPNEVMCFKHIGNVVNGEEQALDESSKKWTGTSEIYKLSQGTDFVTLSIDIDIMEEHLAFMKTKLPIALEKIKSSCI